LTSQLAPYPCDALKLELSIIRATRKSKLGAGSPSPDGALEQVATTWSPTLSQGLIRLDNHPHASALLVELIATVQDLLGIDSALATVLASERPLLIPKLAAFPREALWHELAILLKPFTGQLALSLGGRYVSAIEGGEDFVQEGWRALLKTLDGGKHVQNPRGFFVKVSNNKRISAGRKEEVRQRNRSLDAVPEPVAMDAPPDHEAAVREELEALKKELQSNPGVAILAGLRVLGYSPDQITKMMSVPASTWRYWLRQTWPTS
jgi:DNA-directed RNA polymerase specialized sigma24 family protein